MSIDTLSPFVIARTRVRSIERVTPSFARITFGGDALDDFGTPGAVFDQRIKLIFPPASGVLPHVPSSADWYQAWLAVPEGARGSMRTYSIRDLAIDEAGTSVVIDFVLHLEPGLTGPAASWANTAAVGDELLVIGPRRARDSAGGIEYTPGDAATILLAGDETAAPAIARILEDAAPEVSGTAFIEVPHADDILPITAPAGVTVHWLPREGRTHGEVLIPAVLEHLGDAVTSAAVDIRDVDTEDLLWETPQYSGLGEELSTNVPHADRYFWIAGESGVVTTLRRHLVKDLGVDRSQVAFMGYWRKGVAMRG